jgi:hypothetical protein
MTGLILAMIQVSMIVSPIMRLFAINFYRGPMVMLGVMENGGDFPVGGR